MACKNTNFYKTDDFQVDRTITGKRDPAQAQHWGVPYRMQKPVFDIFNRLGGDRIVNLDH